MVKTQVLELQWWAAAQRLGWPQTLAFPLLTQFSHCAGVQCAKVKPKLVEVTRLEKLWSSEQIDK